MNIQEYVDSNKETRIKRFPRIINVRIEPHPIDIRDTLMNIRKWRENGRKGPRPESTKSRDCIVITIDCGISERDKKSWIR